MEKCHLTNGAANPTTNQHQGIDPQINRQLAGMGFHSYQTERGLTVHKRHIGNLGVSIKGKACTGRIVYNIRNHIYSCTLQAFMVENRYRIDRSVFELWLRGDYTPLE
ncbi:hypothetical protein JHJ32_05890 [Parapedobacter sp. ISTM3]|uniref:hypothetical protein n=1 Tax=Parapedobacter sp. ISTM3 TaxID=2800130 RepID=UPI0019076BB7|nr:hypothetical protein [Parapedobacter sp. ISTM3]MBK1439507.1 hypothetical protein [Parapedobacter sp. ISTM3]